MQKRSGSLLVIVLLLLLTAGCNSKNEVTSITFPHEALTLEKGNTETLVVVIKPDNVPIPQLEWLTSHETIAFVDGTGQITAIAKGEALITATTADGKHSASLTVTVLSPSIKEIRLEQNSLTLDVGAARPLTAVFLPSDAEDPVFDWSSDNPDVAMVDDKGLVTAVKAGTATVSVKTKDGFHTAQCSVTVRNKPVEAAKPEPAPQPVPSPSPGPAPAPSPSPTPSTPSQPKTITFGSTLNDVFRIMGTTSNTKYMPVKNDYASYADYEVTYGNDKIWLIANPDIGITGNETVYRWWNVSGKLKVTLGAKDPNARPFTLGSTRQDVVKAMGTPKIIDMHNPASPATSIITWRYGLSNIIFDAKTYKVISWNNEYGDLKVKLGDKVAGEGPISTDYTWSTIARLLGTPIITDFYPDTHKPHWFKFKEGAVYFDKFGNVTRWDETLDNL